MIRFLHIPKTGGMALWHELEAIPGLRREHEHPLSALPPADPYITIVRDPADRFVSAFAWLAVHRLLPWATPDEMVLATDQRPDEVVYRPLTWWLDTDRPPLWVGHTETLEVDARRLGDILGVTLAVPRVNVSPLRFPPLSAAARARIREWYADDYALLETLP